MKSTCSCKHDYQDEKYGKAIRIFNPTGKDNEYRCTVCGNVKTIRQKSN